MTEQEIFTAALEKQSARERAAFLEGACANDTARREHIEGLLREHENLDSLLERPPAGIDLAVSPTIDHRPSEQIGTQIGPYKLLEQIGEGGMGVVYVAEQTEPVRRRVAIKIIKPGMDTKQVIARFEAERQALAMMDHPNIAKILDAGTTREPEASASGSRYSPTHDSRFPIPSAARPYFVMELVRGLPVSEYCDKARLSPRQRLALFIDVCHAVQHAHQKGVIHRDLKPSNVMITVRDGRPVAKVIDFGVAKAVGHQLTERTVYTAHTQLVGTPLYMSPEQADFSSQDVDTRSDVYSLGVLLYELLTGQTPFDKETLNKAGFDELRRIIREEEPETVSQRLANTRRVGQGCDSSRRPTDPYGPNPKSKIQNLKSFAELDWIVMKALEKDRSRRYESASALAADIQRYLSDEPVFACPPTTMYRFQKFARKHKASLTTAAAIAVCLILGTTVSAWQAARATTAEAQATKNEQKAVDNEQKANAQRDEAQRQRDEVKALNDSLQATQGELQNTLYAAHMNLAKHAWDDAAVSRVHELLTKHRPKADEMDLRGFEWHYLNRLSHEQPLFTLKTDDYALIDRVTFSPDGKRVVGATTGGTQMGKRIEPQLRLWDAITGKQLLTFENATYRSVAFSPDGKRLASGPKVWDAETGNELFSLEGHKGAVTSAMFSPDGKLLASASGDMRDAGQPGDVKVWDVQSGKELLSLPGRTGDFNNLAFSPDGRRLAHGMGGRKEMQQVPGVVKVWNLQTGEELHSLDGGGGSVAFSPDGRRLASRSRPGRADEPRVSWEVKVWDAETGQELPNLKEQSGGEILFSFSPDGKSFATAGETSGSARVKVRDSETGQEIFSTQRDGDYVTSLAFSPDSNHLASSSAYRTVRIWNVKSGQEIRSLKWDTIWLSSIAFSPDGKRLATSSWDGATRLWNMENDEVAFARAGAYPTMSPDFTRLASVGPYQTIKVVDEKSGSELYALKGHTGIVGALAFSPDGNHLASSSFDRIADRTEIKIWDTQAGKELLSFTPDFRVARLVFSHDGKRLAGSVGGKLKVWDTTAGQELLSLQGKPNAGPYTTAAFSTDGKRLASGGKVWDVATGEELLSLQGQSHAAVSFSQDGQRLATGSLDGTISVWDTQTGKQLIECKAKKTDYILSVAFSPDGNRLVSAAMDRTVTVWHAKTGYELLALVGRRGGEARKSSFENHNVAFSPDGLRLASAFHDGSVTFWDATPLPEKP